jgi:hypothetical protein
VPELCFVASLKKFPKHSPYFCPVAGAFLDLEYHFDEGVASTGRIMQISDHNDAGRSIGYDSFRRLAALNRPCLEDAAGRRHRCRCGVSRVFSSFEVASPAAAAQARSGPPGFSPVRAAAGGEGGVAAIHPNDVEGPPGPDSSVIRRCGSLWPVAGASSCGRSDKASPVNC